MVWRLLKKNISAWQIAGYAIATLTGLTIVICALQFYRDLSASWNGNSDDKLVSNDYLVISKPVSLLSTFGRSGDTGFDTIEIHDLERQPWVARVGQFTASDFGVSAAVDMGPQSMSTSLFFESVPDEFFDRLPSGWSFNPDEPVVPIILSKDYLALYNFGFAATRGLPQLNEKMIRQIPLTITLGGNGHADSFKGRVIGFSNRLNTIAVPQEFMEWAHDKYGSNVNKAKPSRLIVEVSKPGAPEVEQYMSDHGYEIAGDKMTTSRVARFFYVMTVIVMTVGAVIAALAFFILILSIYLLMQKNGQTIRDLLLLGYTPAQVARYYYLLVGSVNAAVLVASSILLAYGSHLWEGMSAGTGISTTSLWPSIFVAIIVMTFVTILNFLTIRHQIRRYF